jgi:hypothetical protein
MKKEEARYQDWPYTWNDPDLSDRE